MTPAEERELQLTLQGEYDAADAREAADAADAASVVADIVRLEADASKLEDDAAALRYQAAELIQSLLDAGHSQTEVAQRIAKTQPHVSKAAQAYRRMKQDAADPAKFQEYYRPVKPEPVITQVMAERPPVVLDASEPEDESSGCPDCAAQRPCGAHDEAYNEDISDAGMAESAAALLVVYLAPNRVARMSAHLSQGRRDQLAAMMTQAVDQLAPGA